MNNLSISLMVEPRNFGVFYAINTKMKESIVRAQGDPRGFRMAAQRKWRLLARTKRRHGAAVLEIPGRPHKPDATFSRDSFASAPSRKGFLMAGRMASSERQGEFDAILPYLNQDYLVQLKTVLEGGDVRPSPYKDEWGRRVVFVGTGPRTSPEAVKRLQGLRCFFPDIRFEALPLSAQAFAGNSNNLEDADFFHLDTCLFFARNGAYAAYMPGLTDEAQATLRHYAVRHGKDSGHYEMSPEEAGAFFCNMKDNGRTLVAMPLSEQFEKWLKAQGEKVTQFDLQEFLDAGGGPNCLTNEIRHIWQLSALGIRTLLKQNPHLRTDISHAIEDAIRRGFLMPSIRRDVLDRQGPFRPRLEPVRVKRRNFAL